MESLKSKIKSMLYIVIFIFLLAFVIAQFASMPPRHSVAQQNVKAVNYAIDTADIDSIAGVTKAMTDKVIADRKRTERKVKKLEIGVKELEQFKDSVMNETINDY